MIPGARAIRRAGRFMFVGGPIGPQLPPKIPKAPCAPPAEKVP